MKRHLDATDTINGIRLELRHHATKQRLWVLVEGITDQKLYAKLLDGPAVTVEMVPGGVENLRRAVEVLGRESARVLGIRDADFLHLNGQTETVANLFLTDGHDAEMLLLACDSVFQAVAAEYLPSVKREDCPRLRDKLLSSLVFLGALRWLNHDQALRLNFQGLALDGLYDPAQLRLDGLACLEALHRRSPDKTRTLVAAEIEAQQKKSADHYQLCNGHDTVQALTLHAKASGAKNPRFDIIGAALRVAYRFEDFAQTRLYQDLTVWQNRRGQRLFARQPSPPPAAPPTRGRHYRVFLSSTFLDNQERRQQVTDAILRADMVPIGMERFAASSRPALEECLSLARECELYLGIIAHRYGWIPDGQARSITELEYDAAKAAGKPCLLFEIDPALPINREQDFDPGPQRWAKQEKLDTFRARFRAEHMPALFDDGNLAVQVLHALTKWRTETEGTTPAAPLPAYTGPSDGELQRYRASMIARHEKPELAGFQNKLRVPIDLEELYVPLHAMLDVRGSGDARYADADEAENKLREHGAPEILLSEAFREALARKQRGLVLLGDPGSGKTTQLKRLLLACLREGPVLLGLPEDVLPVFLPLRDLPDGAYGMEAFLAERLADPLLGLPEGFGQRLLERGRLLLLFDGLDEVGDPQQRAQVADWIDAVLQAKPDSYAVASCRFAGYGESARLGASFLELHLRPLSPAQAESFIHNWYRAVECYVDPQRGAVLATQRADGLLQRLAEPQFRSARMAEMTRNPLLLANLCLVHRDRGSLPKNRHQLYGECIDVLLEHWRQAKNLKVPVSADLGRRALQPVALWLHSQEGRTRAGAKELAPLLQPVLQARQWPGGDGLAFLRAVRDDSGLLTGWGPEQFGFMHLGFQEYLAAAELRRLAFEGDKTREMRKLAKYYGQSWWQEVILLLLAQGNPSLFAPFMRAALKQPGFTAAGDWLGLILEEAAEVTPKPFVDWLKQAPDAPAQRAARGLLLPLLQRLLPEKEYQALLAVLPQPTVATGVFVAAPAVWTARVTMRYSANGGVELVAIPGGRFLMGSPEGVGYDDERPQHEVEIRPFYLGRFPVTNEEYARFLQANPEAKEPAHWSDRRFNQARQPVVGVSWHDACRFAEWAGGRLPTEAEWEYACRAGTSTEYWWGDDIGENRTNCNGSGSPWSGKQPSPVGSFAPNPFGLFDTHGNVWEWGRDGWHDNYHGAPKDSSAWEEGGVVRVLRGGSWNSEPVYLRSADRGRFNPVFRLNYIGFRLAQDA